MSNLKMLAAGCSMYSADWDEHHPLANKWMDATVTYVKTMEEYRCPSVQAVHRGGYGYTYNDLIDTAMKTTHGLEVSSDFDIPMIFDGTSEARNAFAHDEAAFASRHTHRGNVAYADGHAKTVDSVNFSEHRNVSR